METSEQDDFMGCPYHDSSGAAATPPSQSTPAIQVVSGIEAVKAIHAINQKLGKYPKEQFNESAPSVVMGNKPVKDFHDPASEIHGVLRTMTSSLGKLMDEETLPDAIKDASADMDKLVREYAETVKSITIVHKERWPDRIYTRLPQLVYDFTDMPMENREWIEFLLQEGDITMRQLIERVEDEEIREKARHAHQLSVDNLKILERLNTGFGELDEVQLMDGSKLPNAPILKSTYSGNVSIGQWFFTARRAAGHFLDTTKIPNSLSSQHKYVMGGKADRIVDTICEAVEQNVELQQEAILSVFHDNFVRIQDTVAAYSTLEEIKATGFDSVLGIDSEETHAAVVARARQNRPQLFVKREARPAEGGGCPYKND